MRRVGLYIMIILILLMVCDIYDATHRNEKRLQRIEKHLGIDEEMRLNIP